MFKIPYKHYQNILNKISFWQTTKSFQPCYLPQHSLDSGKPHQDFGDRCLSYKTEDQLGNEVTINSLWEKTWKPKRDELGPHSGLWLPGEYIQPGIHLHERIRKITTSFLKMSSDKRKLSRVQTALRFFFNTFIYLLLYIENIWWWCLFISVNSSL